MLIRRLASAVLALILAVLAVVSLPSVAEAAIGNTFGVLPTGGQQAGKVTRTDFIYEARPGQTLNDSVSVINLTAKVKYFRIYAADAYNTEGGGFAVKSIKEKSTDVGAWITLPFNTVRVPGKTEANIAFTLKVPANASPGDHQGGIVAVDDELTRPADAPVGVAIQQSIFSRVYVRVAGPLTPGLDVESVRMDRSGSNAQIHYVLRNTGNVRLTPTTDVKVTGLLGRKVATVPPATIEAFLPGSRVEITAPWSGVPQLDLLTVTVTSADTKAGVSDSESTKALVWRWWQLLVPLVLLLAAAFWWWRRRGAPSPTTGGRRRAGGRRAASSGAGEPAGESDSLPVP